MILRATRLVLLNRQNKGPLLCTMIMLAILLLVLSMVRKVILTGPPTALHGAIDWIACVQIVGFVGYLCWHWGPKFYQSVPKAILTTRSEMLAQESAHQRLNRLRHRPPSIDKRHEKHAG